MNNPTNSEVPLEYSIVIPVYNSGRWMDELVGRIGAVMEHEAAGNYELILVNDCSPDPQTWPTIQRNATANPWVRGFNLLYNVGQFKATLCGIQQAAGRYILTMDDDLQHLPEELPKLIDAMRTRNDILCIMGIYDTKRHNAFRNAGTRFYQRIMDQFYGKPANIQTSSFRIMRRELAEAVLSYRTAKPQMGPLIVSLTQKIENIQVQHAPRKEGVSGYSTWTLISTTFDSIIHASTAPLRCFSALGFLCAGGSLLLGLFFLARWLAGGIRVVGFTTQTLLITFFGGMTLAGIGILGEYIARIITEITGPERYSIKERTDQGQD